MPETRNVGAARGPDSAHEPNQPRLRPAIWFVVSLVVCVIAVMLISAAIRPLLGPGAEERAEPATLVDVDQLPPQPRLQSSPPADLKTLRAHEDELLGSYGWVNRQAGTVRIPIGRAMELIARGGLPSRARGIAAPEGGG